MNGRKPVSVCPYLFSVTKMGYRNLRIYHDFSCVVLSYSASVKWVTSVCKVHAVVKLHATIYYAIILGQAKLIDSLSSGIFEKVMRAGGNFSYFIIFLTWKNILKVASHTC